MTKSANDPLVWIDCEMTGLDLELDELIEIAVIVTDFNLEPFDSGIDLLIKPSPEALENMGDFVRQMHTNSGLLAELDNGLSIEDACAQVMEYIKRFVPEAGKAPLAGNSVGTDKTFLQKQMPQLVEYLHYRVVDVSSLKELSSRWLRIYTESASSAPGWNGVNLQESVSAQIPFPMLIENDANAAALAEHLWGEAAGVSDFVYVEASYGIGAGIIANGEVLAGKFARRVAAKP